jgi:hypothetical protein
MLMLLLELEVMVPLLSHVVMLFQGAAASHTPAEPAAVLAALGADACILCDLLALSSAACMR